MSVLRMRCQMERADNSSSLKTPEGSGFTLSQLGQARRGSWCEVGVIQ